MRISTVVLAYCLRDLITSALHIKADVSRAGISFGVMRIIVISALICQSVVYFSHSVAAAYTPINYAQTEQYITDQVQQGLAADLSRKPNLPNEIPSWFLKKLIIGDNSSPLGNQRLILIRNISVKGVLNLDFNEIKEEVWLVNCRFPDGISMLSTKFDRDIILNSSDIGGIIANNSEILGDLRARRTIFREPSAELLNFWKEGHREDSTLEKVTSSANFRGISVHGDIDLSESLYTKLDHSLDMQNAKIDGDCELKKSNFNGAVSLQRCTCKGNIFIDDAIFRKPQGNDIANFSAINVGGAFLCRYTKFYCPFNFRSSITGREADFSYTNYLFDAPDNQSACANFEDARIGARLLFGSGADASQDVRCSEFKSLARFADISVADSAYFINVRFSGSVDFSNMRITGANNYTYADFNGFVDWRGASLGTFVLVPSKWSSQKNKTSRITQSDLRAMSYNSLYDRTDDTVKHILAGSSYAPEAYSYLEAYYNKLGDPGRANDVYIQERAHYWSKSKNPIVQNAEEFWGGLQFIFWGFGKHPVFVAGYCAIIIIFGCFAFRKCNMEEKKAEDVGKFRYSAFWYSLGLFLPVVDLGVTGIWRPKISVFSEADVASELKDEAPAEVDPDEPLLMAPATTAPATTAPATTAPATTAPATTHRLGFRFTLEDYMRIHALLGWILVPILIASWTGLLK